MRVIQEKIKMRRLARAATFALIALSISVIAGCNKKPDPKPANANSAQPAATQAEKPKKATGQIKVESKPAGASVLLIPESEDGAGQPQARGATPTVITDLEPGKYAVHLEKGGYKPFQKSVEVKAGETTQVVGNLKK
jgi:uncharacterized membrane protein